MNGSVSVIQTNASRGKFAFGDTNFAQLVSISERMNFKATTLFVRRLFFRHFNSEPTHCEQFKIALFRTRAYPAEKFEKFDQKYTDGPMCSSSLIIICYIDLIWKLTARDRTQCTRIRYLVMRGQRTRVTEILQLSRTIKKTLQRYYMYFPSGTGKIKLFSLREICRNNRYYEHVEVYGNRRK